MNNGFLISALAIISALTTLTVEGLKKLIGEKIKSYNLLAVIVAVVLTIALSAGYLIYTATAITPQIIIEVLALVFLAFLSATTSFDKVKQLIEQLMR
jgi:Na+-transporting NADH:ubiquinone oxidoreductase subunit NqrE